MSTTTSQSSTHLQVPHPPQWMHVDSPEHVAAAKQKIEKKRSSTSFSWLPTRKRKAESAFNNPEAEAGAEVEVSQGDSQEHDTFCAQRETSSDQSTVSLDDSVFHDQGSDAVDAYRWASVYENQRGLMMFSIPYYSRLSLLPMDPPAFTIPMATPTITPSDGKSAPSYLPNLSLEDYPLPDGEWRWVTKKWMIDMQGDGRVQHDGFEYNWYFRNGRWRAKVGIISAGGWVRRRRWVRLMMRPASRKGHADDASSRSGVEIPDAESCTDHVKLAEGVWKGNEEDWTRCHRVLKQLQRDGRKLEVWRIWLGKAQVIQHDETGKRRQWTEDDLPMQSEVTAALNVDPASDLHGSSTSPDLSHVAAVLRSHGREIMGLFIYAISRADFVKLVACAGLQGDLREGLDALSLL